MDRSKLADIRKKQAAAKAKKHQEILDANASVKDAVLKLSESINGNGSFDAKLFTEQMDALRNSLTFGEEIKALDTALGELSSKILTVENLQNAFDKVGAQNNKAVTEAVQALVDKLDNQSVDKKPEDFQPVRRVIEFGNRLIFDDKPTPGQSIGGGGGGSSIPTRLIQNDTIAISTREGMPLEVIETTPLLTQRYDYSDSTLIYVGEATLGTDEADAAWTISRFDLDDPATASGKIAIETAWTNRASGDYN